MWFLEKSPDAFEYISSVGFNFVQCGNADHNPIPMLGTPQFSIQEYSQIHRRIDLEAFSDIIYFNSLFYRWKVEGQRGELKYLATYKKLISI